MLFEEVGVGEVFVHLFGVSGSEVFGFFVWEIEVLWGEVLFAFEEKYSEKLLLYCELLFEFFVCLGVFMLKAGKIFYNKSYKYWITNYWYK